jgi:transposase
MNYSQSNSTESQNSQKTKVKNLQNVFQSNLPISDQRDYFFKRCQELEIENEGLKTTVFEKEQVIFSVSNQRDCFFKRYQEAEIEIKLSKTTISEQGQLILRLKETVKLLRDMIFGKSSERDKGKDPAGKKPEGKKRKPGNHKGGPKPLPDHLSRVEVKHYIDREELKKLGYEIISESKWVDQPSLQMKPIEIFNQINKREQLEVIDQDGNTKTITAGLPEQILPKSKGTNSVLASIISFKFALQLPFYRISQFFGFYGLQIKRSTMCKWMIQCAEKLIPLFVELENRLKACNSIGIDETIVQVLKEPGKKPESKSVMWVRITQNIIYRIVLFNYSTNKSSETACLLLKGVKGYVQADGTNIYNAATAIGNFKRLGCAMHARRKFKQALVVAPVDSLARHGLDAFKDLYTLEATIKNLPYDERKERRLKEAKPVWDNLFVWAKEKLPLVQPKTKLAEALNYLINEFGYLTGYLDAGHLEIDNGEVERAIRPFAIGRKNWLFCDSMAGARASAMLYSLVGTIKLNKLPVYEILSKVFDLLPYAKTPEDYSRLADILTGKTETTAKDLH